MSLFHLEMYESIKVVIYQPHRASSDSSWTFKNFNLSQTYPDGGIMYEMAVARDVK